MPEKLSLPEREQLLSREGKWMLDRLPPHTFLIALCLEENSFLPRKWPETKRSGCPWPFSSDFSNRGSCLADELKRKADLLLSFPVYFSAPAHAFNSFGTDLPLVQDYPGRALS